MTKKKRPNAQDATRRNVQATNKRMKKLEVEVAGLRRRVKSLEKWKSRASN